MSDQLLSSDPAAGLLSTDPGAGVLAAGMSAPPPAPTGPPGSERTRRDTNAIGIDHERIANGIANWASTLPRSLQKPAAMLATFPADTLASLVEMLSAPESVATMGAKPAMAAMDATAAATGRATAAAGDAAKAAASKVGAAVDVADPDLVSIISPRGGAALKKAQQIREFAQKRAAQAAESAVAPPETVAGGTPPPAGPPPEPVQAAPQAKSPQQLLNEEALARRQAEYQARQGAPSAPPEPAPAPKPTMNAAEAKEYLRLRAAGKTDQQAREAIEASRAMNAQFGLSVPTTAETTFPKGMRGKVSDKPPLSAEQRAAIRPKKP